MRLSRFPLNIFLIILFSFVFLLSARVALANAPVPQWPGGKTVPPVDTCSSQGGQCVPSFAGCGGIVAYSYSCPTDSTRGVGNELCCIEPQQQCATVDGAQCMSSCNGDHVSQFDSSCGGGNTSGADTVSVCCIPNSGSQPAQPTQPPHTGVGQGGAGGSGVVCSNYIDPKSVQTFNQCGCDAGGVSIPKTESVKVKRFNYSGYPNNACPADTQFTCGTATQCPQGCSGSVCNGSQPKVCPDGHKPGDILSSTIDSTTYKPLCKKVEVVEQNNCTPATVGTDGKTPIAQVPAVDCSTLGITPTPPPVSANTGTSTLCSGPFHCDPCNVPTGQSTGTQKCYENSNNQLCLTQSCSNQSSNAIFNQTCTQSTHCNAPAPTGMNFKYTACTQGSKCTGVGGGGCGYCQTATNTTQIQAVSTSTVSENQMTSATSWLACDSQSTCKNQSFMDVNHDGKINVLDYNQLLNQYGE